MARVLVVDDHVDSAESLCLLLQLSGHDVSSAHDGEEALVAAERFRPEVVLMDIGMPRLDGYETARRLRAAPWAADVLLVALTGWDRADDRERCLAAGFDRHLPKPVDAQALSALLEPLGR